MEVDHPVKPRREVEKNKAYRVESRCVTGHGKKSRWGLFNRNMNFPASWENGPGASYVYESEARYFAQKRSEAHSNMAYRIVRLSDGAVLATYQDGLLVGEFGHQRLDAMERGGMQRYFRADHYEAHESRYYSSRSEASGRYTRASDDRRWHLGLPRVDLIQVEMLYLSWVNDETGQFYKRARIVEVDAHGRIITVLRQSDTDDDSGLGIGYASSAAGEGTIPHMHNTNINVAAEPLLIPRETIVQKLHEEDARLRTKHEERQTELATQYQGKLAKIADIAGNQFLVLAMVEGLLGSVKHYEDAAEVSKALQNKFGDEPGTQEYETPQDLAGLISVMEAATATENVPIVPENNLYKYVSLPSPAASEAPSE